MGDTTASLRRKLDSADHAVKTLGAKPDKPRHRKRQKEYSL